LNNPGNWVRLNELEYDYFGLHIQNSIIINKNALIFGCIYENDKYSCIII